MGSFVTAACTLAMGSETCFAFTSNFASKTAVMSKVSTSIQMKQNENDDRRVFLSKVASISGAVAVSTFLPGFTSQPALAFGNSIGKVNAKLASYGLPLLKDVPSGFSPIVELYGKGRNRKPLLVEFLFPSDWVVVLPNNDLNTEEGTIQAGQYSAGDTATLFVWSDSEKVEDITAQPKEFFQTALIKAISQKGENVYQNFKITKLEPSAGEYKDQKYMLVDFRYELLTGAGFEVDRRGVASITNQGTFIRVLWSASTRQRYKKTEESLRIITKSFRCFAEGLGITLAEAEKEGF